MRAGEAEAQESDKVHKVFGSSNDEEGEAREQDDYRKDAHDLMRFGLQLELASLDREIDAVADGSQVSQASVDVAAAES